MPDMGKEIHLNLDSLEVGQILDGLRCRQESWANKTSPTFISGFIANIERQVDEQRGL